jgi:anti-anti-sigma regulatory factor
MSPGALRTELAGRGLSVESERQSGRLVVLSAADSYTAGGTVRAAAMITILTGHIDQARREGYEGLRITSDMCWAIRPVGGLDELMPYESAVSELLVANGATAVCQYDRQSFDTVTLAGVAANHGLAVAAVTYHHDAMLRICRQHVPSGLRVAGEIDYRALEPLTQALNEALALDEHVHINLARLAFVDAVAAGALLQAALSLSATQRMTIRCQPLVHKVLQLLGATTLAGLTLVLTDDG